MFYRLIYRVPFPIIYNTSENNPVEPLHYEVRVSIPDTLVSFKLALFCNGVH